jgi:hypothetical protein
MNKLATTLRKYFLIVNVITLAASIAYAGNGTPINDGSANKTTLAIFGDWPYSVPLLNAAPLLINSINSDPHVRLVLHIGDIHAGSTGTDNISAGANVCTGAGLTPIPPAANPNWNIEIFNLFEQFKDPLVYTPGDNEWTDCHKTKEGSSGAPLKELAAVRDLFFPEPGYTLGGRKKRVLTQAESYDPSYPTDHKFVENVMWEESQVVFVTLNMPGSNNDGLKWTTPFTDEAARLQEVAERNGANMRWLDRAFAQATADDAKAVLIGLQADMWDPAQDKTVNPGGDGLDGYTDFVKQLANLALQFDRPVLLVHGDSHLYFSDKPLADPNSATGKIHKTAPVPNLTRISLQGSVNTPSEWLRLSIDPRTREVFSWENVVYLPFDMTLR